MQIRTNHDDAPFYGCVLALAVAAAACGSPQKDTALPTSASQETPQSSASADSQGPAPLAPEPNTGNQTDTAAAEPQPPEPRRGGNLIVHDPPQEPTDTIPRRLRSHVEGALSLENTRVWVGPPVPAYIDLTTNTAELFLLDPVDGGHFAFFREPYGSDSGCSLDTKRNCLFAARYYSGKGNMRFSLGLNRLLSREDYLEIQDIRYDGNMLYFNEACQSYSREAGGKCSALVAVNPWDATVVWRTPPLISNNRILVLPEYIVAGYGFTNEPDFLSLVSRKDGKVLHRLRLKKAHSAIELVQADPMVLQVQLDDGSMLQVEVVPGKKPALRLKK